MTESEKMPTKLVSQLKDGHIRSFGIPFFGIAIPLVTGLIKDIPPNHFSYWISFPYFILLSGVIWQGNRYLLFRTRSRFTWFDRPVEKLILLVVNNIFYTAPVTIAMLCLWYWWIGITKINWTIVQIITLVNIICVLFITHVYETVFMLKEQENEQLKSAQLERAKAEAELIALRNQIDPHFMFNSLNTLTYLIQNEPPRALHFTENLAEIYRYILLQKDRSLVLLEDELDFTHKYTDLLHLRFGKALLIEKLFDDAQEKKFLIPPNSVFMAFENAVKHNEISEDFPLNIRVDVKDECLIIANSLRLRENVYHSSNIGIKNLDERFKLLTGKNIISEKTETCFTLSMPLIAVT
jgi:sensor histidine kinase YesM